jgi:hypothetical protein
MKNKQEIHSIFLPTLWGKVRMGVGCQLFLLPPTFILPHKGGGNLRIMLCEIFMMTY